jgi:dolichol-phosphate mannosyltransferase
MNLPTTATPWKRYLIFCGVGASGLLVDMSLFHLLHTRLGWPLEVSKLVSAETALLNNFVWNDRWTFGHRPVETDAPWPSRLLRFHLICLSGIALTLLLLGLMHRGAGIPADLSNAVAIVGVSGWNFAWSRRWGWKPRRPLDGPNSPSNPPLPPDP